MRLTDMRGVDITKYRFDYDLTFAALTLNEDGTVYHRYGGRDKREASHWATASSLNSFLGASLEQHEEYSKAPKPPDLEPPLQPERIPAFAKRDKGDCIHCHNVHEGLQYEARDRKTWTLDDIWVFPEPGRFGFDLDVDDQRQLVSVREDSPAGSAQLQVGDRLIRIGQVKIATATDVMYAGDEFPMDGGKLEIQFTRNGAKQEVRMDLAPGWKRGTPRSFAWRALKWTLEPVPGFGGPVLDSSERAALKLPVGEVAFRINYFVTWGERARFGRAAGKAGLRAGDVVIEVGGKRDFESVEHFHAWWRLTRQVDEVVSIHVLREGKPLTIELKVLR